MTSYDWPGGPKPPEMADDVRGRQAFVGPRRTDFDPDGARRAGRIPARASGGSRGAPAAPRSGRTDLWVPLGPTTVLGGQATGTPRIAGRVNAIAISTDGNRVYAASGNGGIWFSSNAGSIWQSLGGFAATDTAEITRPAHRNAAGAITLRPGGTLATDQVFVGTGEPHHFGIGLVRGQPGQSRGGIGILVGQGPGNAPSDNPWVREAPNLVGEAVYRIAVQPGGSGVVAATTSGLFERPAASGADVDWTRVSGTPFSDLEVDCSDVLWTPAAGTRPERLWVWVRQGDRAGLWVRETGQVDFIPVPTGGSLPTRAVLASSIPPTQIWVFNDGDTLPAALFRVTSAAAGVIPVATLVTGNPEIFNGFGFYDIAMAVHPAMPNRVVLGGSTFATTSPDGTAISGDGAVVWADVAVNVGGVLTFGQPAPPAMVGVGVHADVHDITFANAGARLWAACDGGVYRSDQPTGQAGFYPRNTGLSIIESNFVTAHPTCEGFIATGLQDNGVITRLSNGVWRNAGLGDGGGIVLDPVQPDRWLRQHYRAFWSSSDGSVAAQAMLRRGGVWAKAEHDASAFYSSAAAVEHFRGTPPPAVANVGQIIIGTTRVWYTEDFGVTWTTLPTGTDPLPGNLTQDAFGERVTVCRWQSPDVAWILGEGRLMRYARVPGSDTGGGPGTWSRALVIKRGVKNKKDETSADGPIRDASVWTDIAVNLNPASATPPVRGTLGAVYLGTIGHPDDTDVDTLWWFDGTDTWHPTGLRSHPNGVPAPVTSILCDRDHPEQVWVGTTVGLWRGVRTLDGTGGATWDWEPRVNGLPEACVEDLALFSDGGLRILRAAIASRGVWELRLDVAEVSDLTYLRAHDDDLRYRASAITVQRDGQTVRSWHGSPDVRPRVAPTALAPPGTLPWRRGSFSSNTEGLRRFQSALRSRTGDARVRATGQWDDYFNEVLRGNGAPLLPAPAPPNTVGITSAFWTAQMAAAADATREPWGAGIPTEEDLHELTAPLVEGSATSASCRVARGPAKIDVVIHHRGLDPRPGADVRVTLLRWVSPVPGVAKWHDATTWFSGNVPWTGAVNDVLNSAAGTTTKTFGDGWRFVESGATRRRSPTGQTIDGTRSGIVTFDLNLGGFKRNTIMLLVAIIRSGTTAADDIALATASLRKLVLDNPHVAVRSLRVGV